MPYEHAYDDGFEELGRRQPDTTALRALTGWPRRTIDDAIDDVVRFERAGFMSGEVGEGVGVAG